MAPWAHHAHAVGTTCSHPPWPSPSNRVCTLPLQMLMLINRSPVANSGVMWGDKDTFSLAFAMAGKAHCYNQVAVPPCGYLHTCQHTLREWQKERIGNGRFHGRSSI